MSNVYNLLQKALNTVSAFDNGTSKYVFQAPFQFKTGVSFYRQMYRCTDP